MTSLFTKHDEGVMWATKVHPIETEKNGEIKDNPNIKEDIREFGGNVTLHGIRYITDFDMHLLRRLAWLIGLAILGVYLCYEVGESIWKYWEHPIATVITMNYVSNITFPAITICNYNLFKSTIVTPQQAMMVSSIFNVNPAERLPVDWAGYERSVGRPLDVEGFVVNTAHQMEDMLLKCSWRSTEPCTAKNFTRIITDWGVCYSFNNDPATDLQVKRPGSTNGLSMMINIEQNMYTFGENTGAGLKVLLHPPGQFPLVKELGFSVSPGFETSVSVRYNSITNLADPYPSNCSSKQLVYSNQYSVSLCRYECKVAYVTKICGCKDVRYQGENVPTCSPQKQVECIYPAEVNFTASDIDCDCQVACSSFIYEGRISTAYWPAIHAEKQLEQQYNISEAFARKNLLELKIYFEELSYQEIRQIPAYDVGSLQSDIGGMMGLLCGMSIVTVGEFFDFVCGVIVARCARRKARKGNKV